MPLARDDDLLGLVRLLTASVSGRLGVSYHLGDVLWSDAIQNVERVLTVWVTPLGVGVWEVLHDIPVPHDDREDLLHRELVILGHRHTP